MNPFPSTLIHLNTKWAAVFQDNRLMINSSLQMANSDMKPATVNELNLFVGGF